MPSPAGQPHAKRIPERLAPKLGTGYSPLSYLKRLPSDEVKIDRSFLATFPDKSAQAVVGSVIDLCHRLGMGVAAEGVEGDDVLEVLRDLGCDLAQGYLFGRPMPAAQLTEQLVQTALPRHAVLPRAFADPVNESAPHR